MSAKLKSGLGINFGREKKIDLVLFVICILFVLGFLNLQNGFLSITGYATFNTSNSSDFNAGSYNLTFFNASVFVQLNTTELKFKGNYTSKVFDVSNLASWSNISWCEGSGCLNLYGEELPANQKGQQRVANNDRRINMTGNVLYFRFNNQSTLGENQTHIYDLSGNQNNGTFVKRNGTSSPALNQSVVGQGSFYLDGDGDLINVSTSNSLNFGTGDFAISLWLNIPPITSGSYIIAKRCTGGDHPCDGGTTDNWGYHLIRNQNGTIQAIFDP